VYYLPDTHTHTHTHTHTPTHTEPALGTDGLLQINTVFVTIGAITGMITSIGVVVSILKRMAKITKTTINKIKTTDVSNIDGKSVLDGVYR